MYGFRGLGVLVSALGPSGLAGFPLGPRPALLCLLLQEYMQGQSLEACCSSEGAIPLCSSTQCRPLLMPSGHYFNRPTPP